MTEGERQRASAEPAAGEEAKRTRKILRRRVQTKPPGSDAVKGETAAALPTRAEGGNRETVFVAMPYREEYDRVFAVVQEAAANLGMVAQRADQDHFIGSIISHVRKSIEASYCLVAIASEENGNVYYEIGLAHCQKKPVVLLTSDADSLKFDLRDHRAIVYDPQNPRFQV